MVYSLQKIIKIHKYNNCAHRLIIKSDLHCKTDTITNEPKFKKLDDKYSREDVEDPLQRPWDTKDRFKYVIDKNKTELNKTEASKVFSVALPPPNVTGSLHLGHALTTTLQDVLCRFKRLNGQDVCWLPGFDHAGIATQVIVEKYLAKKNITRQQLGYEKFCEEVWKWKEKNEGNIKNQLRSLGASLDWSKEVFTMDDNQTSAVKEAFIRLFDEGLIYRSHKLVNWSCALKSSISDIEVDTLEISEPTNVLVPGYSKNVPVGWIYEISYRVMNSSEKIEIATTRPETLLGDVAVAVHPDDARYSRMIGKYLKHPFSDRKIPVLADEFVDMKFGTGALKITPAHDKNDYAIAEKHNLEMLLVIDQAGNIEDGFSMFSGMHRYEAREAILEELKKMNLLRSIKEHKMLIPICSRSGDIVEQLPHAQWYLNCTEMYKDASECVKSGKLQLIPDNYERVWEEWLKKNKDWCISRQLWWGHRIPAYKCHTTKNNGDNVWVAARNEEEAKVKASKILKENSSEILCFQDNDVLDTWFSSAIYPFSSHGWPNSNEQLKRLYPLSTMITGHDITFFWVARMVMFGLKLTGKLPFSKVLLHGVICDNNRVKMSKSRGNVIEPDHIVNGISLNDLKMRAENSNLEGILSDKELAFALKDQKQKYPQGIPACGTDALRFTLCNRNVKSSYIQFDVDDCHRNYLFCNKIWQSLRFSHILADMVSDQALNSKENMNIEPVDAWILSRLSTMVQTVYDSLDTYDFHIATTALKQFLYFELCDTYIECTKKDVRPVFDENKTVAHCHVLGASFNTGLRLLSPFMPFLSEKLIDHIPVENNRFVNYKDSVDNLLIGDKNALLSWKNVEIEEEFETVLKLVSCIRQIKIFYDVPKKIKPEVYVKSSFPDKNNAAVKHRDIVNYLSASESLCVINEEVDLKIWSYTADNFMKVYIKLPESHDENKHFQIGKARHEKKVIQLRKNLEKLEKISSNVRFKNAPIDIQTSTHSKIVAFKDKLKNMSSGISVE